MGRRDRSRLADAASVLSEGFLGALGCRRTIKFLPWMLRGCRSASSPGMQPRTLRRAPQVPRGRTRHTQVCTLSSYQYLLEVAMMIFYVMNFSRRHAAPPSVWRLPGGLRRHSDVATLCCLGVGIPDAIAPY